MTCPNLFGDFIRWGTTSDEKICELGSWPRRGRILSFGHFRFERQILGNQFVVLLRIDAQDAWPTA